MEMPPANWSPYSRADRTKLQLQFRPPRDGPSVSTCLRDYASPEEISVIVAALQLRWREHSTRARGANRTATSRMSAAAQDAALAAMWATAGPAPDWLDPRYLRDDVVHHGYRDHAALLPEGPAKGLLLQFYTRYEAAQAAALEASSLSSSSRVSRRTRSQPGGSLLLCCS